VYNQAHLKLLSVHPASPILLTKKGPQRGHIIEIEDAFMHSSPITHPFKV